jgi:hypothetical protein
MIHLPRRLWQLQGIYVDSRISLLKWSPSALVLLIHDGHPYRSYWIGLFGNDLAYNVTFLKKKPTCSPDNSFWIIVYVLKAFLQSVNFCLKAIQGMTTLLNEQKIRLDTLISELIEDGYVEGPGLFESNDDYVLSGSYRVSLSNVERFILDQDLFVVVNIMQQLQETDVEDFKIVCHSTALLFSESINGFSRILAERNEMNQPTDCLPPVLPPDLLKLRPYEFAQLIALHQQRLIAYFNEEEIIGINEEFKKIKDAYRREEGLKAVIDGFNTKPALLMDGKCL